MTLRNLIRIAAAVAVTAFSAFVSAPAADAQTQLNAELQVAASFGDRVKMVFDRTAVVFDTEAYDPSTIVPVKAAPLSVTAKARVPPNARVLLTVQADGPFTSGTNSIPANKLSYTITGPGFGPGGNANQHAARTIGSWRGSGEWQGTQTYEFLDSWDYVVGSYSLTMTYTVVMP